jgi:hypothetical protein
MLDTPPNQSAEGSPEGLRGFPGRAQLELAQAPAILAEGGMPDLAKHLTGLGVA